MIDRPRLDAARRQLAAFARPVAGELVVEIIGEVNALMVERVNAALRRSPRASALTISIDSQGGDVAAAFQIFDMLRAHKAETKRAIVKGACFSAAFVPLLAADHRRALTTAKLLTHQTERKPSLRGARWTTRRYAREAAALAAVDARVIDLMCERTGASRASLAAADSNESEKAMGLGKAIALGFLHEAPGHPTRCSQEWPAQAEKIINASVPIGLPRMFFSDAFLAACKAAPR